MGDLNTVQNGKGSKPRIQDKTRFDNNFDSIDWNRKTRDKYTSDSSDQIKSHRPKN